MQDASGLKLTKDLEKLINESSRENASNTPDYILAEFMAGCLFAGEKAIREREKWYGTFFGPGKINPVKEMIMEALNELGQPTKDYPTPVANAVEILRNAYKLLR